jgi:hypothetical protein
MHFRKGDTSFRLFYNHRDTWNAAGGNVAGGKDRELLSDGRRHGGLAAQLGRLDPTRIMTAMALDSPFGATESNG